MIPMKKEPTIQDVLDAIQVFSTAVDRRFDEIRSELKGDIALVNAEVGIINHKLDRMDVRVNRLEVA